MGQTGDKELSLGFRSAHPYESSHTFKGDVINTTENSLEASREKVWWKGKKDSAICLSKRDHK